MIARRRKYSSLEARLLANVQVWTDEQGREHWLWQGRCNPVNDYGQINLWVAGCRRTFFAHRLSFELFKGSIPPGTEIAHACHIPSCINPNCLDALPHRDNCAQSRRRRC